MPKMIFVNLPVRDLAKAVAFYEAVGAAKNRQFSDDVTACMVFSDTIYAMLMTHERFRSFTPKTIPDAHASAQVLLALTVDSREEVDAIADRAIAAGGKADPTPRQDLGFMYGRSYEDPDGHIWELAWMNLAALEQL